MHRIVADVPLNPALPFHVRSACTLLLCPLNGISTAAAAAAAAAASDATGAARPNKQERVRVVVATTLIPSGIHRYARTAVPGIHSVQVQQHSRLVYV